MEKICFIIDDEDQSRFFASNIQRVLKNDGCEVIPVYINAKDPELLDENQDIDIEKLKKCIKDKMRGKTIDVIATDFNLSDENIDGLKVIEVIRDLGKKTPIVLYSGSRENVIKSIVGKPDPVDPNKFILHEENLLIENVKRLILNNISDFVKRTNYDQAVIKILKENESSTRKILLKKLREYPDMVFQTAYPQFNGKCLSDIADEIENSTHHGQGFQEELMEQTVSYMLKISDEQ